jgi:hypothetical protein
MPKKHKPIQPLPEESFVSAIGNIIERDFFPELTRLRDEKTRLMRESEPSISTTQTEVIDLSLSTTLEEFHSKYTGEQDFAFRKVKKRDGSRQKHRLQAMATSGGTAQNALLFTPKEIDTEGIIRTQTSHIHPHNTRLPRDAFKNDVRQSARISGTEGAKSIEKSSRRLLEGMAETAIFDPDVLGQQAMGYFIPEVDEREELALKLEQEVEKSPKRSKRKDILKAGLV